MTGSIGSYPFAVNTRVVYTPVILYDDKMFRYVDFSNEEDMKRILMRFKGFLKRIFGGNTIYIPVERLLEGEGVRGIPDAFLLIINENGLDIWIVEFELIRHGVKSHIKPQIERFTKITESIDPDQIAEKIYHELNRIKKVRYIKEIIFGPNGIHKDLVPVIRDSLVNSGKNILIILNRVNQDLIKFVNEAKKNGKYSFEIMVMQLYSNGKEEMLLITPFAGSMAAEKPIEYTVISRRRMDKYWLNIFKLMNMYGFSYKRRRRRKREYIVFYDGERPIMVIWKSVKKGIVNIRVDYDIVQDYLIKMYSVPPPKKCKSFCKIFRGGYKWDSYIEVDSSLFSFDELSSFLDRVFKKRIKSG